jgi:3-keto steroid reductase
MRGEKEVPGWREGLRIVFEELDVDRVGGDGGVLDFAERIRNRYVLPRPNANHLADHTSGGYRYPYLTTLVLNAGMGAFLGLNWTLAARQFFTDPVGCVSEPDYIVQEKGKLSADGERGGVWGVNVLSTYILVSTLPLIMTKTHPDILRSPKSFTPTSLNPHRASLSALG